MRQTDDRWTYAGVRAHRRTARISVGSWDVRNQRRGRDSRRLGLLSPAAFLSEFSVLPTVAGSQHGSAARPRIQAAYSTVTMALAEISIQYCGG